MLTHHNQSFKVKSDLHYGGILMPPKCKINNVNMQHNYVHVRLIYVNMQDNYFDMQHNLSHM